MVNIFTKIWDMYKCIHRQFRPFLKKILQRASFSLQQLRDSLVSLTVRSCGSLFVQLHFRHFFY